MREPRFHNQGGHRVEVAAGPALLIARCDAAFRSGSKVDVSAGTSSSFTIP